VTAADRRRALTDLAQGINEHVPAALAEQQRREEQRIADRQRLGVTCDCLGPPYYVCAHWPLNLEDDQTPVTITATRNATTAATDPRQRAVILAAEADAAADDVTDALTHRRRAEQVQW
jgi:hypothetical protein